MDNAVCLARALHDGIVAFNNASTTTKRLEPSPKILECIDTVTGDSGQSIELKFEVCVVTCICTAVGLISQLGRSRTAEGELVLGRTL